MIIHANDYRLFITREAQAGDRVLRDVIIYWEIEGLLVWNEDGPVYAGRIEIHNGVAYEHAPARDGRHVRRLAERRGAGDL